MVFDFFLLIEAVGERGCRRLVDDAQHLEAGDAAGVLGRLTLGVVEVGGDGDDGLRDLLAELGFGGFLHLLQDEGRDLLRGILLAVGFDPGVAVGAFDDLVGDEVLVLLDHRVVVAAADEALDGEERVERVGHRLSLGGKADELLVVGGEGNDRRRRVHAFGVFQYPRLAALHDCHARVRGSEVDADHFSHVLILILLRQTVRTRGLGVRKIRRRGWPRRSGPLMEHPNGKRRLYKVAFPGRNGRVLRRNLQFSPPIGGFDHAQRLRK